ALVSRIMNQQALPSFPINNKEIQFLAQETTTLIVKNLPSYSEPDLIDFLKHFGPREIRLGKSQQLKNSAFLDFPDRVSAETAFSKIHEIGSVAGKNIRVEYALPSKEALKIADGENGVIPVESSQTDIVFIVLNYPPAPTLYYRYPPPTVEILQNIMNAIAAVPKLYTQVLHLMNKMNLPPPFSPVVPESIPTILQQHLSEVHNTEDRNNKKRKKKDDLLSEDESEIESEDEEEQSNIKSKKKVKTSIPGTIQLMPSITTMDKSYLNTLNATSLLNPKNVLPSQVAQKPQFFDATMLNNTSTSQAVAPSDPIIQHSEHHNCITIEEINKNKKSNEELKKLPMMKKYAPGEPSRTLYIKNLAQKKIEEKDLEYLFGKYFNSYSDMKSNLEIQLMKEGRMRGQAFIKFPNIEMATRALNELHGYVVHDKPMVI
ncbi:7063_t:CDS:2, partial [Acaulospora morrowiae]